MASTSISTMNLGLHSLMLSRGLRNSEIRIGIRISDIEPCHTELILEFRKKLVMEGCQKGWLKSNNAGHLQLTNFTMFRYTDDAKKL